MVHALAVLESELPKYISNVKSKNQENAKAVVFSSFIQKVFGIQAEELDFEVSVKAAALKLRGRIDAVFGNLIIEFKKDLKSGISVAEDELLKYFQAFHEKYPDVRYLGMANDGINFRVYQPIFQDNIVVKLDPIDKIDLEKASPEDAFLWFDSYLFTSEKVVPTSKDLKKRFGLESPTFATVRTQLRELFTRVQAVRNVQVKYDNWARFLEIIYGDKPNERDLFFKHTYLSAFVKILLHLRLSKGKAIRRESVSQILYGDVFKQSRILNFIEEDFFVWIFYPPLRKESTEIIYKLLQELSIYDLDKIDEDVLKELYQELVDPDQRKLLGEFYTPDWLAELMVTEVLKDNPELSVMDPSCGSGTFLFKTISYKISALRKKGWDESKILNHILESVVGFDVHPLAATIAKTNYLLSLKDILNHRKGPISIPVYLSDSLKLPQRREPKMDDLNPPFEFDAINNEKFLFPPSIANDISKMDDIVEKIRSHGEAYDRSISRMRELGAVDHKRLDEAQKQLLQGFSRAISDLNAAEGKTVTENLKTIFRLINEDFNSIWTYIIRNMYKPVALTYRKVDVILGNPPWSALQFMKNERYQNYLKERSKFYDLADKAQNITHLELATLFFCQCVNQYLKKKGTIAFVMPKSVLVASHHEKFLSFEKPQVNLFKVFDLEDVSPLFRIPSCVLFAREGTPTKYPTDCTTFSGSLNGTNSQLSEAKPLLTMKQVRFEPLERTTVGRSFYYDKFFQGATFVPRSFWLVDIKTDSLLSFDPTNPIVESEENRNAKAPWNKIKLKGNVESQFLFSTILSNDLVPFGYLRRRLLVLPVFIKKGKVELISKYDQPEILTLNISRYLEKAEGYWQKHATPKSKRMSIYDRLNYQRGVINQRPTSKFRVLYVSSATYMTSCVIRSDERYSFKVDNQAFNDSGFFAESTTYCYDTDSENEAYYLCAILNSATIDDLIKPFQARGDFGERHIHKIPLTFPIPKFDDKNDKHRELAKIGLASHQKVQKVTSSVSLKSIGKIRSTIREQLAIDLDKIDALTRAILKQ